MNVRDIHELLGTPARLAIVATLAGCRSLSFTELRNVTGLADGNLHVQARRLVEAGWLVSAKQRRGNRPVTCYRLTEMGRQGLRDHARKLGRALDWDDADPSAFGSDDAGAQPPRDDFKVW